MMERICNVDDYTIAMKCITQHEYMNGLIDYQSKNLKWDNILIKQPSLIFKTRDHIQVGQPPDCAPGSVPLLSVSGSGKQICASKSGSDNIYLVIRGLKYNNKRVNYQIQQGDVIKFSNISFNVQGQGHNIYNFQQVEAQYIALGDQLLYKEDIPTCRLCWIPCIDNINPLINGCKCKGSARFIHLQCLRQWLDTKKTIRDHNETTIIRWKTLECDICGSAYQFDIDISGNKQRLIQYQVPDTPHLILACSQIRVVCILKPSEKKTIFKIGRNYRSDLRINDNSVSRQHAVIKFKEGKFFLKDSISKFGTQVLIQKEITIEPGYIKPIQIGKQWQYYQ